MARVFYAVVAVVALVAAILVAVPILKAGLAGQAALSEFLLCVTAMFGMAAWAGVRS